MRSQKAQPAGPERNRRCTATCADGTPCSAWAVRGTDPPLCAAHGGTDARIGAPPGNTNALKHGYHASRGVPLLRTKKFRKTNPPTAQPAVSA